MNSGKLTLTILRLLDREDCSPEIFDHINDLIKENIHSSYILEKKLEQTKDFMRTVIDNLPDLVFVKNSKGEFILANKALADLFELTIEEVEGKTTSYFGEKDKLDPDYIENYIDDDMEVIKTKKIRFIPEEPVTDMATGITRYYQTIKIPLTIGNDPDNVLGVSSDITERKKNEEDLKKLANNLKKSNEEFQQFASIASHELKAPIRIVSNYCLFIRDIYDRMGDKPLSIKEHRDLDRYIEYITSSIIKMRALIDDLLEYSKVGKNNVKCAKVNVQKLLNEIISDFKEIEGNDKISFCIKNVPEFVVIDKGRLGQIFHNLISNSIKFRDPNEESVIEISSEQNISDYIFYIKDNGVGIEKEQFDRIFGLFKRLYTDDEYPGTGIGLALTKRLVENNGGRIWVESEVGKGSTFFFSVPIKKFKETL